ncbi:hypothetical protein KR222_007084, partial [Zaprionus bogoriensis]
ISCVAALILKKISDEYSERVLRLNKKILMEWDLLNSISSSNYANDFIVLTIMGFTFISFVLLITRIIEKKSNYSTCEIFFLTCGFFFFVLQGLLLLATVEDLSDKILYFAYSLAGVSFMCSVLFAMDLIFFKQLTKSINTLSQTDFESSTQLVLKKELVSENTKAPEHNHCCAYKTSKILKTKPFLRTDI